MAGAFIAIGHEPQSAIVDGLVDDRRERLRPDRGQVDPHQRRRASSPPATSSTTPTARPSPRPAPAVRPRSTPSGTCATTPLSRPPRPSRAPATWPSSSGHPPRARSGRARRRRPRGLRRRRQRRNEERPPGGPRHDRSSPRPIQGRRRDPGANTCDGAGTAPTIAWRGRCRRAPSSSCWSSRTPTPRDFTHWTVYGIAAASRQPAWRPTASSPRARKRQELGRQGRLDAAVPAQGRRRAPLHLLALRAAKGATRSRPARARRGARAAEGRARARHLHGHLQARRSNRVIRSRRLASGSASRPSGASSAGP